MVTESLVWAILFLPLLSFLLISLVVRPFLNRIAPTSGILLIIALAVCFILSLSVLLQLAGDAEFAFAPHTWIDLGNASIQMGLLLDPVTAVMLVVVSGVSLLIQIYSLGYMRGDPGVARYFAYMSLFTAAMLGLVLSANIVQLYAFWELVGVSSYLLIGFWHDRPSAAAAAKKAFIVTRIGDVGFLLAIIYLFYHAPEFAAAGLNPLHIPDIWQAAQPLATGGAILGGTALTLVCLGIFAGAAGKSGQFPLHSWLPDAMEGPTPVSALIHAATMVAAGVFLVARFFPPVPGIAGSVNGSGLGGRLHGHCRRHPGPGSGRHQAGDGLLHHQPAWVHDGRARFGRLWPGPLPSLYPRLLQGAAVPGGRQRESRLRHLQHALYGRPQDSDALDLRPAAGWRPEPGWLGTAGRFLEQG